MQDFDLFRHDGRWYLIDTKRFGVYHHNPEMDEVVDGRIQRGRDHCSSRTENNVLEAYLAKHPEMRDTLAKMQARGKLSYHRLEPVQQ